MLTIFSNLGCSPIKHPAHLAIKLVKLALFSLLIITISRQSLASEEFIDEPEVGYIVGGTPSQNNAWPFLVALVSANAANNYLGQFCGGSLIAATWVITAAHCVNNTETVNGITTTTPVGTNKLNIVTGVTNLFNDTPTESITIKRIITHPNYQPLANNYDLALIELTSPSSLTPIKIYQGPIGNESSVSPLSTTIGWGQADRPDRSAFFPTGLRQITMPIVSEAACAAYLNGINTITQQMICAGYGSSQPLTGGCVGDSGGPMVNLRSSNQYQLLGVVSWGPNCQVSGGYTVYARISAMLDFIFQHIPDLKIPIITPIYLLLLDD